jgi:site-specific recombinase XerD
MNNVFKVFFYPRKNYVYKNGEVGIRVLISLNGDRLQFASELTIPLDMWNEEENRASGKYTKAKVINNELEDIEATLKFHYRELKRYDSFVTVHKVRDAYIGVTAKSRMLLEVFKEYNEEISKRLGKDISNCTVSKYKRTKARLAEFIKYKFKKTDIPVNQVNYSFICSFDSYLTSVWNCGTNTKVKYLQHLKCIITLARNNGWMQTEPFTNFKIKRQKSDRGYLTQEELMVIMQKKLAIKRLEYVRDIFVFSCFTGLSYIDVKKLERKHIQSTSDDSMWVRKKREKTGVQSNILLLDVPKKILAKYIGMLPGKQVLPVISNQRLNSYLKEIADLCGIEKNLTFHLARHTFATTVTLAKGVPLETVSKMLGHTSLKTTQIYARITDQKIGYDMQKLSRKLHGMGKAFTL